MKGAPDHKYLPTWNCWCGLRSAMNSLKQWHRPVLRRSSNAHRLRYTPYAWARMLAATAYLSTWNDNKILSINYMAIIYNLCLPDKHLNRCKYPYLFFSIYFLGYFFFFFITNFSSFRSIFLHEISLFAFTYLYSFIMYTFISLNISSQYEPSTVIKPHQQINIHVGCFFSFLLL